MPLGSAAPWLLGLVVLFLASAGSAATYPELSDPSGTFVFRNVVDERGARPAPAVSLNNLDFWNRSLGRDQDPVACSRCPKGERVVDRFSFDVVTGEERPRIAGIFVDLAFEVILQSFDPELAAAAFAITGALRVSVFETSDGPIDPIEATGWLRLESQRGVAKLVDGWHASITGVAVVYDLYTASASVDVDKLLRANGVGGEARGVSVSLEFERRVRHVAAGEAHVDYVRGGGGPGFLVDNGRGCSLCPGPEPKPGAPVPEPGTAVLAGLGLAVLAARRPPSRRRRAKPRPRGCLLRHIRPAPELIASLALIAPMLTIATPSRALEGHLYDPSSRATLSGFERIDGALDAPRVGAYGGFRFESSPKRAPGARCDGPCPEGVSESDRVRFELHAHPEGVLYRLTLSESFGYGISAPGPDEWSTFLVSSTLAVEILALDGVLLEAPLAAAYAVIFSPSSSIATFSGTARAGFVAGSVEVDLREILSSFGRSGVPTALRLEYTSVRELFQSASVPSGVQRVGALGLDVFRGVCLSCPPPAKPPSVRPPPLVPEPSTALSLGFGLAALARRPRRRRRARSA